MFKARLTALKDMLTAAKTVRSTQIATIRAKLRILVDGIDAVRPVLVTNPLHFSSSSILDLMFMRHPLAPDK